MTQTPLCLLVLISCCAATPLAVADPPAHPSAWQSLLQDHSAPAWRGWKDSGGLPAGWQVKGGVLSKQGDVDDLVTVQNYGNFELELEWKLGKAGNSGIFYRGTHEYDHIYWSAPEYQLLDDAHTGDGKDRLTAAGSVYALYGGPAGVVHNEGHWNKSRLIVRGSHVEHWLNGKKFLEYELGSAQWKAKVAASKYAAYPHYGLAATGFIGLQGDHPGALAIRHIRIRELP